MLIRFNMLVNLLVPDALLRKLLLQVIIKSRNGELLVIPLILTDFFCFLCGGGVIRCLGPTR